MAFGFATTAGVTLQTSTLSTEDVKYDPIYDSSFDAKFLWDLLPSFYALMDDRDLFESVWEGLSKAVAGDILNAWSVDYSKSLRDVPPTSQRKWFLFKPYKTLSLEEDPVLLTQNTALTTYSSGKYFDGSWLVRSQLDLSYKALGAAVDEDASLSWTVEANLTTVQNKSGALWGYYNTAEKKLQNAIVCGAVGDVTLQVSYPYLAHYSAAGDLTSAQHAVALSKDTDYRFDCSYAAGSTVLKLTVTEILATKLSGTGDSAEDDDGDTYTNQFTDTDTNFETAVVAGDFLSIDSTSHEILDVSGSVLTTKFSSIPSDMTAASYDILGEDEVAALSIELSTQAGDPTFNVDCFGTSNVDLRTSRSLWALPFKAARKRITGTTKGWKYADPFVENSLVEAPRLQDNIINPDTYWYQGIDFTVTNSVMEFVEPVTIETVWAEYARFDEEYIYNNFGAAVDHEGDSSSSYRAAVRGLYYSYFRGPTVDSIRSGVHILVDLPIADVAGTVTAINADYSGTYGQIVINKKGYLYPLLVGTDLSVSDEVVQFQRLCNGVQVIDYVNDPDWFGPHGVREIEKFHTFMVYLDLDAFDVSRIALAGAFVDNIKPTWKKAMFVAHKDVEDTVELDDPVYLKVSVRPVDGICGIVPDVAFDAYEWEGEMPDWQVGTPESDWRADVGLVEWEATHGALRGASHLLTKQTLGQSYLTGTVALTDTSDTGVGTGTLFTTEITLPEKVLASRYFSGSAGVTTDEANTFSDATAGAFTGVVVDDDVVIGGAVYEVLEVTDANNIVLDHTFDADATGVSWEIRGRALQWATVDATPGDTSITFSAAFSGTTGDYLLQLVDEAYLIPYADHFSEICPDEELTHNLDVSPGYQETLLGLNWTFSVASDTVTGAGIHSLVSIGDYVVTPAGIWYEITDNTTPDQVTVHTNSAAGHAQAKVYKADEVLAGTLAFTPGSAAVPTTDDLTSAIAAGDWIQAVPHPDVADITSAPVVEVLSRTAAQIVLTSTYAGDSNLTTKAIKRGAAAILPLAVAGTPSPGNFTDWYGTAGGTISTVTAESTP
jgi:hypothetical protein